MKILLISDSHDNIFNLEKVLRWAGSIGIQHIIHAGDICAPGVVTKTFSPLLGGQMHIVFGNVGDRELLEQYCAKTNNIKYYGDFGEVELDNKKIAFVHFKEKAEASAKTGKYDLAVFGHSHQSEVYKIGQTQLVNPGTIGGLYNRASFAVYDTKNEKVDIEFLDQLP
ncbi:MAG: YfcE family phosphodiesterase [Candidatus Magasanikbacteria bacterium]|nr:YfcE family phosphodiesterase [Candidatus Magasanikbacteria bacterium]